MTIRFGISIGAKDEATPTLEKLIARTERTSLSLSKVESTLRGLKETSDRMSSLGTLEKRFAGLQGKIAKSESEFGKLQNALTSAKGEAETRRLAGAMENLTSRIERMRGSSEGAARQMREHRKVLEGQGVAANGFAAATERVNIALEREKARHQALNRLEMRRAQVRRERDQDMNAITGMTSGGESLKNKGLSLLSPLRSSWGTAVEFGAEAKLLEGLAFADENAAGRAAGMAGLKATARMLGEKTTFSSRDALKGMQVLARAGYVGEEIGKATQSLLNIARAGETTLDTAASVASSVVNGFGMARTEIGKVGDVISYAANKADASFVDMGEAFSYVSSMSKASGFNLEMAAAAIGVMSDNAIKGSRAGTALKGMISRLADPSKESLKAIEKLGVKIEDSKRNFRGWIDIFGEMKKRLDGMGNRERLQSVSQIFGLEAAPGALALIENVNKLKESTASVSQNAKGFSDKLAAISGESAKAKLDALSSSFENLQITLGSALEPMLVKHIERLSDVIQKMDRWASQNPVLAERLALVAAGLGGLAVVGGTVLTTFAGIAAAMASVRFGLKMMGVEASGASLGLGQLLGRGAAATGAAGVAGGVAKTASRRLGLLGTALSVGMDAWDALGEKDFAQGTSTLLFGKKDSGYLSQALKWGGLGALGGSVAPGIGTLGGALGGAFVGLVGHGMRSYEAAPGASSLPTMSPFSSERRPSLLDLNPRMSRQVTVNAPVSIYAAPGMDERAIGESVAEHLRRKMAEDDSRERARFHD